MTQEKRTRIIGAHDVGNYVVCPEAWRLKYVGFGEGRPESGDSTAPPDQGKRLREEWAHEQEIANQLKRYAKIVYLLLFALVIVVFLLDQQRSTMLGTALERLHPSGHISGEVTVPKELLLLLIILGILIFVWDLFDRVSNKIRKASGIAPKAEIIALKGSNYLPGKRYFSPKLSLSSQPDALLREGNEIIPVDRKPFGNKVRDRHVVQMLMHLRLIEELEGKHPSYGLLLLGPEVRPVKIKNTEQKQRWLDTLLDEMWAIMDGIPAVPAPSFHKCKGCDVRKFCNHSAYHDTPPAVE